MKRKRSRIVNIIPIAILLAMGLIGCSDKSDNAVAGTPPRYNPNGTWSYTLVPLVYDPGTCGFTENPYQGNTSLFTLVESSGTVTAVSSANGIVYTGTYSNNTIHVEATFLIGGFLEIDIADVGLTSNTQGSGMFTWGLSNGAMRCTGSLRITATKV